MMGMNKVLKDFQVYREGTTGIKLSLKQTTFTHKCPPRFEKCRGNLRKILTNILLFQVDNRSGRNLRDPLFYRLMVRFSLGNALQPSIPRVP